MNMQVKKPMEGIIERDSEGLVRLPDEFPMTSEQLKELVEQFYVRGHINLKIKQHDKPFAEMGGGMKGGKSKTPRKWTDDERKIVLQTVDETTEMVGEKLGRSGMSIYMQRAALLAAFEAWKHEQSKKGIIYPTMNGEQSEKEIDDFLKVY
jgi:hypothetical protein